MSIKLNGATSGSVELDVPAAVTGGDVNLSLPGAGTVDRLERAGNILQVVSTTKTDVFSLATQTPTLITGLTASITPSSSSSKVLISIDMCVSAGAANYTTWFYLYRGGSVITGAQAANSGGIQGNQERAFKMCRNSSSNDATAIAGMYLDSPSTTSATTYQVYMSGESGQTHYINKMANEQNYSYTPRTVANITIMEIAA